MKLSSVPHAISITAALAIVCAGHASASNVTVTTVPASIEVSGHATFSKMPDEASLVADIVTNDQDAAKAVDQNDEIVRAITDRLKGLGIDTRGVHTVDYRVTDVEAPAPPIPPGMRLGRVVTRSIRVDTTPGKVATIVRAMASAGVDSIESLTYDVTNRKNAYETALGSAVDDARARAEAIARAAHLRITRISTIRAGDSNGFMPRIAAVSLASIPPPEDVKVDSTITIVFEVVPDDAHMRKMP